MPDDMRDDTRDDMQEEEPQEELQREGSQIEESPGAQTSPPLLNYTPRQRRDQPVAQAALSRAASTPLLKVKRKRKELGTREAASSRKNPRVAAERTQGGDNAHTPTGRGRTDLSSSPTSFLKELVVIPQDMAQPDEIFKIFTQRCTKEKGEHILLLTRLLFILASPEAFDQLSEACTITRQKDNANKLRFLE